MPGNVHPAAPPARSAGRLMAWALAAAGLALRAPATPADGPAAPAHPTPATRPLGARIDRAIVGLTAGDPAEREAAAKLLLDVGAMARPALLEASASEDPELRVRASELLLRLPWYMPDDPPDVRRLLAHYGQADAEKRKETVLALSRMTANGYDALLRLLPEEPSDGVRWAIAAALRTTYRADVLERCRALASPADPPRGAPAPLLAAAGHAWFVKDVHKGAALLKAAVRREAERPSDDGGELGPAFDRLAFVAVRDDRIDELAWVYRTRAATARPEIGEGSTPRAVLDLFALHARLGPLDGLGGDIETYARFLEDPRVLYCLGAAYGRGGQRLLAATALDAAYRAGMASAMLRFSAGDFLHTQGWHELAAREWRTVLSLPGDERKFEFSSAELNRANAHFRLSQNALARGDDFAAAEHLRQAMELHYQGHGDLSGTTEQAQWQEIDLRYLLAARKRGDRAATERHLAGVLKGPTTEPDVVIELVRVLRELGRAGQARELFDKAYEAATQQLDARPDSPMPKNNLAWLLARCGERKEEALDLARQASALAPDNPAFMDTLAEALYQNGLYDEAIRVETLALKIRPGERFFVEQIAKFEKARGEKHEARNPKSERRPK